jgi:hypothetical protein
VPVIPRALTSSSSLGSTSSACMFSWTCSTLDAPVMTVDTLGLDAHHAIASCARVQSSSSATS